MMVNNLQIQKPKLYFKKVKSKFCRVKKCTYLCKKFRIMTDKEKIELIMQEKHLNNTQFCNEVCIAPGTLSHIRSGRTEPSLNILRSVSMAFPDINPSWLFLMREICIVILLQVLPLHLQMMMLLLQVLMSLLTQRCMALTPLLKRRQHLSLVTGLLYLRIQLLLRQALAMGDNLVRLSMRIRLTWLELSAYKI